MRLVAASALIAEALPRVRNGAPAEETALAALAVVAGVLLLAGLWTPIVGTVVTVLGCWGAATQPADPWARILLAALCASLALLGPGAWSLDARLFGWKRIHVRDRRDQDASSS